MSIKVMTWLWDKSEQKSTELLTLLALADWCDDEGKCWPGLKKLQVRSRYKGMGGLYACLERLLDAGELAIEKRGATSHRYYIRKYCEAHNIPVPEGAKIFTLSGTWRNARKPRKGSTTVETSQGSTPVETQGSTTVELQSSTPVETNHHLTIIEPSNLASKEAITPPTSDTPQSEPTMTFDEYKSLIIRVFEVDNGRVMDIYNILQGRSKKHVEYNIQPAASPDEIKGFAMAWALDHSDSKEKIFMPRSPELLHKHFTEFRQSMTGLYKVIREQAQLNGDDPDEACRLADEKALAAFERVVT